MQRSMTVKFWGEEKAQGKLEDSCCVCIRVLHSLSPSLSLVSPGRRCRHTRYFMRLIKKIGENLLSFAKSVPCSFLRYCCWCCQPARKLPREKSKAKVIWDAFFFFSLFLSHGTAASFSFTVVLVAPFSFCSKKSHSPLLLLILMKKELLLWNVNEKVTFSFSRKFT